MKTSRTSYAPFISGLLFAVSALILFAFAFLVGFTKLLDLIREGRIDAQSTIIIVILGFEGLLSLIAAVVSFLKISKKPAADASISPSISISQVLFGVIGTAVALWIGGTIQGNDSLNWIFLPLLTIPAVSLPIWIILGLGIKKLPFGSRWQTASIFGISMTVTPFVLFILELIIGIFILVIVIVYALVNPDVAAEFQRLSRSFMFMNPESEQALKLIAPLLKKPGVVITMLTYFSVLVPLTEELIKPLGVWLFVAKLETPVQGFAFGALCGAGYGLIETLNVGTQVDGWSGLLFSRIGTDLLHIANSGLMGMAIVLAWHEKHYLRLLGTYLLTVLLHGLWNLTAVAFSIASVFSSLGQSGNYNTLQAIAIGAMAALSLVFFTVLVTSNRKLRSSLTVKASQEDVPTVIIGNDPNS